MMRERPGQGSSGAGTAPMEQPTLVWERADGTTMDYPLVQSQPITLGRDAANTVVLDSGVVSKRHALVRYEGGQYLVEDLRSANGTRLNGAPVSISTLAPGDLVEVGDQLLRVVDRGEGRKKKSGGAGSGSRAAAAGGSPASKLAKLAVVALIFGGGLFMLLRVLFLGGGPSSTPPPIEVGEIAGARWTLDAAKTPPPATNAPIVLRIIDQAKIAGVNANDALFDEAKTQYGSGRLVDAARLFAAVVERDPAREVAQMRLNEVKSELEEEIARHRAEAERMSSQLRFDDAAAEWERVLLLLEPSDARVAPAKAGLDAARRHARTP